MMPEPQWRVIKVFGIFILLLLGWIKGFIIIMEAIMEGSA